MGGISIWQLVIVLAIVLVVFGTKRLRGMGGDVGTAIKGFKDSMKEGEESQDNSSSKDAAAAPLGTDAEAGAQPDASANQATPAKTETKSS